MNLDDLEQEVLGAARREMTPAGEAAARVHAAVLERLAVTAVAHSVALGTAGSAGLATAAKVGVVIAVGGIGLAGGWAAFGRSDSSPAASVVQRAAGPAPSVISSVQPRASADEAAQPSTDARPLTVAAPRARSRRAASFVPQSEQRLAEEVSLLAEADRALRARNPARAAKVLAELERKVPHGKLDEERTAVQLVTNCLQSPGDKVRAQARSFLLRHPSTVYAGRIRESCQLAGPGRDGSK
ncbi:MAG: hypothetical protein JW940_36715 [Polyangiaceae bacterium]|nr:hypothetical protein [Polyangiaceae bacterium]